jgi:trimeric autotransporter adhesin
VFHSNMNDKASGTAGLATRARGASATAAQSAQSAAQAAQSAAQSAQAAAQVAAQGVGSAAQGVGKSVRQQVHTARGWAAPRLENAADYCTATVAPRVSSAIRATARQVSPEDVKASKTRKRASWSFLVIAALAAAGAAAAVAVARQRYKAAMDADTEPDTGENSGDPADLAAGSKTADANGADSKQDTAAKGAVPPQETSADPSMNGQVSSPGR